MITHTPIKPGGLYISAFDHFTYFLSLNYILALMIWINLWNPWIGMSLHARASAWATAFLKEWPVALGFQKVRSQPPEDAKTITVTDHDCCLFTVGPILTRLWNTKFGWHLSASQGQGQHSSSIPQYWALSNEPSPKEGGGWGVVDAPWPFTGGNEPSKPTVTWQFKGFLFSYTKLLIPLL